MQNILFPTDFSRAADAAFTYVLPLARAMNAEIHCLHAYNLVNTADWLAPTELIRSLQEDEEQHALSQMESYLTRIKNEAKQPVPLHAILRPGFAGDSIAEVAADLQPDLIVMGTKGATNPLDRMIGSITSQTMTGIRYPILAIPQEAIYSPIRRIAYATDLAEPDRGTLAALGKMAKDLEATVLAVHVLTSTADRPDQHEVAKSERTYRQATGLDDLLMRYVQAEDVAEGLAQFMEAEGADMLATSTHQRPFFERLFHRSVTRRLALYAHKPLLVFRS